MQGLTPFEQFAIYAVLGVAILGLAYAWFLRSQILREDKGTPKMQEVWGAIRDGADAYLRRQLNSILPLIVVLTVALFFSVYIVPPSPEALERFAGQSEASVRLIIGLARAIAFVMGAGFSLTVGQIGMRMAVQGNVRVAAASKRSFGDALRIAYRAGTITGMLTDGLGLFGGTIIFIFFGKAGPDPPLGFGFGGPPFARFVRVKDIVNSMNGGPATTILSGLVQGYESAVWSVIVISATIFSSILIFGGVDPANNTAYILYGVALTGIGMVALAG